MRARALFNYLYRGLAGCRSKVARYSLPDAQCHALGQIFGVTSDAIASVEIEPHSAFARIHGNVIATTRLNAIYLTCSGERFAADPKLVLHEYFHVIRQWNTGELTVGRYAWELLRKGYWRNKYEIAARQFADDHVEAFRQALRR